MVASLLFGLYTTINNEVSQRKELRKQVLEARKAEVSRRASFSTTTTSSTKSRSSVVYPKYDAAISARPLTRRQSKASVYTPSQQFIDPWANVPPVPTIAPSIAGKANSWD